jgi:hypothetical protein
MPIISMRGLRDGFGVEAASFILTSTSESKRARRLRAVIRDRSPFRLQQQVLETKKTGRLCQRQYRTLQIFYKMPACAGDVSVTYSAQATNDNKNTKLLLIYYIITIMFFYLARLAQPRSVSFLFNQLNFF